METRKWWKRGNGGNEEIVIQSTITVIHSLVPRPLKRPEYEAMLRGYVIHQSDK